MEWQKSQIGPIWHWSGKAARVMIHCNEHTRCYDVVINSEGISVNAQGLSTLELAQEWALLMLSPAQPARYP